MGQVALIATQAYPYAGKSLKAGEAFDASEHDAALLILLGRASKVETTDDPPKPKRTYRRRDLVPDA